MNEQTILFFADKLPPAYGGMEMHAEYFISYYTQNTTTRIVDIITTNTNNEDCVFIDGKLKVINLMSYLKETSNKPEIIFFNNGHWIEEFKMIKSILPDSLFVYRTGGNEIIKAPLVKLQLSLHKDRQAYWAKQLNENIDALITNSAYTESRLVEVGVNPLLFRRVIGGVDVDYINKIAPKQRCVENKEKVFFSACRFVPYKNHLKLIHVFAKLKDKGLPFKLKLAGDGPLLQTIKEKVIEMNLGIQVEFIGVLSNHEVLNEMSIADFFIQLSSEYHTEVPGGNYIHAEGMGRTILEAISSGTYLICANTGALPEVVTPETGLLLNLDNEIDMLNKLENLICSKIKVKKQVDTFSWKNCFDKYDLIFQGL
jgi:glycosyltransferase involved in cell wall biosynthesis